MNRKKLEEKALKIIEEDKILSQVKTEKQLAKDWLAPRWEDWKTRLRLYNNQKRDSEAVGNSLLYTLMNTLLAYLYLDKLQVRFDPRESGDVEKCELVSNTAKFDYNEMRLDRKNYNWLWDSLFFGAGIAKVGGVKDKTPVVEIIDPFVFYLDPNTGTDIQDARFCGIERAMTKSEMERLGFKNIDKFSPEQTSQTEESQQARKEAQNEVSHNEPATYENKNFIVLEWYTYLNGIKYVVFTDYNCSFLLKDPKPLIFKDKKFPFVIKQFSPIPHEFWGVSIPDLVEDKQRATAILLNLSLAMEKAKLYPQYLFDTNSISNIQDLKHFDFNKFTPVNLPPNRSIRDVITPLQQPSITSSTQIIHEMIRDFALRSTGATDLRQGATDATKRTATELQLSQLNSDTRNSLAAKLFTIAEKEFWQMWLARYKQYKALVKGKVVRIQGALGVKFEDIKLDTFEFDTDPDVVIESSNLSIQQAMIDRANLMELSKVILDQNAPTSAQRYFKKRLLQLSDFTKDEIDQILPPSFDEMRATEENAILEKDKLPEIDPQDDHYTHISIHNQVADNPSKIAHIQEHKKLLIEKREEQELKGRELPKELPPELPPELTKILGAQGSMGLPSELGAPEGVSPELGQQMPQEMPQEMPQI